MKLWDMLSMALGNLFKRKARTVLTVMGVVIGTCAIIIMISFGIGVQKSWMETMEKFGDLTSIQVNGAAGGRMMGGDSGVEASAQGDTVKLDDKTVEEIKNVPGVIAVTPAFFLNGVTVSSGKYQFQGMIYGVNMSDRKKLGYEVQDGSLPQGKTNKADIMFGNNSAYDFMNSKKKTNNMINPEPKKDGTMPKPFVELMKDKFEVTVNLPENSTIKQKAVKLNVLGVLKEDFSKQPQPSDSIFMDLDFAKQLQKKYNKLNNIKTDNFESNGYQEVYVKVSSVDKVEDTEKTIKGMGFSTHSMTSERDSMNDQTKKIQMFLGGLGAVSLLVAALGIANTMIMSIYERTREIGIMKVLGCVIRNIRTMFLIESGAIGFIGGSVGIALSYLISNIINSVTAGSMGNITGAQTSTGISVIPLWLSLGALAFSTLVGLLSGLHPANRAMKINALTAIKQE